MRETVSSISAATTTLAPPPVPVVNTAFKPIRNFRLGTSQRAGSSISSATLIPLFYAAVFFLAGIVLAHFVYLRPGLLLASLLPLAVIAIAKTPRLLWLPLAVLWLILGAWSAETERLPAPDPALLRLSDGLMRTVEGTVTDAGPLREMDITESLDENSDDAASANAASPTQKLAQRIDLEPTAAEVVTDTSDSLTPVAHADAAKLRLTVIWPANAKGAVQAQPITCGETLRVVVRFLPPDTYRDPAVWNRASYLEGQGITATGSIIATRRDAGVPRLTLLGNPGTSAACLLNRWRDTASARLESLPSLTRWLPRPLRATSEDAAMLTAMLTGDRSYLTRGLRAGFERTGSFHLIVVSGLHLAILAGCIFALARRLRLPQLPTTILTIVITLAYALFTGFAVPAQRSFWMITLYLVGRLLYRDRSPLNAIGFATLCLATASPRSVFDASFQMTLISVAAIAGIAAPLLERTLHIRVKATRDLRLISLDPALPPRLAQFRITLRLLARHLEPISPRIAWKALPFLVRSALRLGELLFVTLVVELALALPMAVYFHRITIYALPVNLFILPLLGLLLPAAMLLLLVLAIWPPAAAVPGALAVFLLHMSVGLVRRLGALSLGDLRVPEPAAWQIAAALLLLLLALLLARERFNFGRPLAFLALAAMVAVGLWPRPVDHPASAMLFEAIDVGQGDSLLLITPDGKTLLVDGGGIGYQAVVASSKSQPAFDIGEDVVSPVLWSRGIRRLDAVALTHAHNDHMGGLVAILRNFHPRQFWVGNNPPGLAYNALLQEAAGIGIPVRSLRQGDRIQLGQAELRVLAPSRDYRPGPQPGNNDSLVLQARYGQTSILLEGDAEAPLEHALLAHQTSGESSGGLQSTVLKVGHHGSVTSTRPEFLAKVAPGWAVISCGRRNRFGHPRPEILAELEAAHVRTLSTDTDGAVCLALDGKSVTVQQGCNGIP